MDVELIGMNLKLVLLLAAFGLAKGLTEVRYDNYKVYNVQIEDAKQLELLNEQEKTLQVRFM